MTGRNRVMQLACPARRFSDATHSNTGSVVAITDPVLL